jgi:D-alanine-D-alanine ligase
LKLFERLDCRDYCRLDWRLDSNGTPKLLEVNPNPGWCWDGHLAKMAKLIGISYSEMLGAILNAAEERLDIKLVGCEPFKISPLLLNRNDSVERQIAT